MSGAKGMVTYMENERTTRYALFSSILIALGSILWLFINIYAKNYERIVWNIVSAILGSTLVFFNLRHYLKAYNKKRNIALDLLGHMVSFVFYILLIAVMIVVVIGFGFVIGVLQEKLFIKEEYLMYFIKYPYFYLFYVIVIIVAYEMVMLLSKEGKISSRSNGFPLLFKSDKFLLVAIIPLMYLVITSVVVITKDGIYDYSFYNLKGNKYNFSDVRYVHTGFVGKGRDKGEFFYNIQLKDGKKFKLAHSSMYSVSEKYDSDSWQEYVDIDKYIMNGGAKKDSSEQNARYVGMDKKYVDKLLCVVRNK